MAAKCPQTLTGIAFDCTSSMGGVRTIWLAPYDEAVTITAESGVITDISNLDSFVKYNFRKNTASMTSTLNVDAANGINFVSTELNMVFGKMETSKRVEIQSLVLAEVFAIVKDANGKYWFLGKDEGVSATAGTGQTGTVKTDANSYNITLTDESLEFPCECGNKIIEGLAD